MPPLLHKLGPALLLATGVVLLTLAVLTFSPLFGAVSLALCCALAGWARRPMDPDTARALLARRPEPAPTLVTLQAESELRRCTGHYDS